MKLKLCCWLFFVICSYAAEPPTPFKIMRPKVFVIIYNPIIEAQGGKRLTELFHWRDADSLAQVYVADLKTVSGGQVDYQLVKRAEMDEYPVKLDGFRYTDTAFLECWQNRSQCHQPDGVDYLAIIQQFNLIPLVEAGEIDEVWLFGFPYGGFWESTMVGQDAFYCNSDPVPNTSHCARKFIIMGFNYEREVGCMLEDFGHRTESIMSRVFAKTPAAENWWDKFCQYDQTHPGQANCGNVHFAPNSVRDYDWGNPRQVVSNCDDWYNFPNFKGQTRMVDGTEWGHGDMRAHHLWWFRHLPKVAGTMNGIDHNWWPYLVDPNLVE